MPLDAFTREIHRDIPLSQHMGFAFRHFNCAPELGAELITDLPLAPNINDKQTAFGGSIATLATLSGWSLVTLLSRHLGRPAQVVVYHSEQRFTASIEQDFYSVARIDAQDYQTFCNTLSQEPKAKVTVSVDIYPVNKLDQQSPSASYQGKYLASPIG
ncbi:YiiD C-terminal domain-containing protein [Pseudoteredinibacter isoporae]|uniref:Thioesterase domain-containing protein n=1 Tax=Pseudoteredinibacter isoporae TaxID=570281 RepID=A0A7X0JUQ5_9GAMM|nr:YiiD C-terminal domain-containing protein [Pseudoteredinibacter isoporae]MBB6522053.1 thioesterase domain-containing protein [Pseudoteredinibacter isoporae]NHO87588.1 thioesterase [Pseudoteredinibacter isoporae]NIB24081.1 thioesterase [Pseudoteredinibacter isoporae]